MRIIVAGAGIGGLTSALALAAEGHEVTLYERRTGFSETGAGIQLSPNATQVLARLGVLNALRRVACAPERVAIRDLRSGREIGSVALGPKLVDRFGAPFLAAARADLHTCLLDAVRSRPGIRIRVGRGLIGLAELASAVEVTTETASAGRKTDTADLLVGADGLWSATRGLLGDRRAPIYTGDAAYRAVLPLSAVPEEFARSETGLWLGPGRHVVHYPIAAGRLLNVVAVSRRSDPVLGWSRDEDPQAVRAIFDDAAGALRKLIAAPEAWSGWSLYELPIRSLAHGRVALVGDAAHPVLPYLAQGGSLAIEDAAHLAARLGRDPATVPEALRRLSRERYARIRRVQRESRRNRLAYHAKFPVSAARNAMMRRLGPEGAARRLDWLYGWRAPGGPGGA